MEAKIGNIWAEITLTSVSYIPELKTNLLSIAAISLKGITTTFNKEGCTMLSNGITVAIGKTMGENLYIMDMEVDLNSAEKAMVVERERTALEWHQVLGHSSSKRIDEPLKNQDIVPTSSSTIRTTCPQGKGTHNTHQESTRSRTEIPGEVNHVVLGYITNKEAASYNYYLLSKDEASEFVLIHFLKNKSEVTKTLAMMIIDIEIGCGNRVKIILSDNGSEFKNKTGILAITDG